MFHIRYWLGPHKFKKYSSRELLHIIKLKLLTVILQNLDLMIKKLRSITLFSPSLKQKTLFLFLRNTILTVFFLNHSWCNENIIKCFIALFQCPYLYWIRTMSRKWLKTTISLPILSRDSARQRPVWLKEWNIRMDSRYDKIPLREFDFKFIQVYSMQ